VHMLMLTSSVLVLLVRGASETIVASLNSAVGEDSVKTKAVGRLPTGRQFKRSPSELVARTKLGTHIESRTAVAHAKPATAVVAASPAEHLKAQQDAKEFNQWMQANSAHEAKATPTLEIDLPNNEVPQVISRSGSGSKLLDRAFEFGFGDNAWDQEKTMLLARYSFLLISIASFYLMFLRWDMQGKRSPIGKDSKGLSQKQKKGLAWKAELEAAISRDVPAPAGEFFGRQLHTMTPQSHGDTPLPTIWPKFIKLHTPSQLVVPSDKMDNGVWKAHVFGNAGAPLLEAQLREDVAQRCLVLEITTAGLGGFALASVSSKTLTLRGLGGMTLGRFDLSSGIMSLVETRGTSEGQTLMKISSEDETQLGSTIRCQSVPSGRELASAVHRQSNMNVPYPHFDIQTQPGVDVVLTLACVMAKIAFQVQPKAAQQENADAGSP